MAIFRPSAAVPLHGGVNRFVAVRDVVAPATRESLLVYVTVRIQFSENLVVVLLELRVESVEGPHVIFSLARGHLDAVVPERVRGQPVC